jgi:hypothetical protein
MYMHQHLRAQQRLAEGQQALNLNLDAPGLATST